MEILRFVNLQRALSQRMNQNLHRQYIKIDKLDVFSVSQSPIVLHPTMNIDLIITSSGGLHSP